MSDTPSTAGTILRTTENLLGAVNSNAAALPKPWGLVLAALEAAVGLAADLVDHGLDPATSIDKVRSALPDVAAARAEVDALIAQKSRPASR